MIRTTYLMLAFAKHIRPNKIGQKITCLTSRPRPHRFFLIEIVLLFVLFTIYSITLLLKLLWWTYIYIYVKIENFKVSVQNVVIWRAFRCLILKVAFLRTKMGSVLHTHSHWSYLWRSVWWSFINKLNTHFFKLEVGQ